MDPAQTNQNQNTQGMSVPPVVDPYNAPPPPPTIDLVEPTPTFPPVQQTSAPVVPPMTTINTPDEEGPVFGSAAASTESTDVPPPPIVTGGDTTPTPSFVPMAPKPKFGGGKMIATIFGVLLLVAGVGVGTYLVQKQQNPIKKASDAAIMCVPPSSCSPDDYCWVATTVNACLKNGQPEGSTETFAGNYPFDGRVCYTCDANSDEPGAYKCSDGNLIGGNPAKCQGGPGPTVPPETPTPTPHATPTTPPHGTPTPTPGHISASCKNIKAFDANWVRLDDAGLAALKAGAIVKFTVRGETSEGEFTKARFTINGVLLPITRLERPGVPKEFYIDYTVPSGVTQFTVGAEIYHRQKDKWF